MQPSRQTKVQKMENEEKKKIVRKRHASTNSAFVLTIVRRYTNQVPLTCRKPFLYRRNHGTQLKKTLQEDTRPLCDFFRFARLNGFVFELWVLNKIIILIFHSRNTRARPRPCHHPCTTKILSFASCHGDGELVITGTRGPIKKLEL